MAAPATPAPPAAPSSASPLRDWFIRNHVAAMLVAITIAVSGAVTALFGVRREVFPEIKPNIVTVQVVYPGATPAEVEEGVCMRIEEVVEGITGVDKVSATASEGGAFVVIEALNEADMQQVLEDVKARVDGITNFPQEIEQPVIARLVVRSEVINVAIHGAADERTLKVLGQRARDRLAALPEISQVELVSVRPDEISIEVSEAALQRHGLTFDEVARAVGAASLDLPAGQVKSQAGQTLLRVKGQAWRGPEFEALGLLTRPDGTRVTLGEVARVVDGFADVDVTSRFDGQPAALLKVYRIGDQDALAIAARVTEWCAGDGALLLPPGVQLTPWRDQSRILRGRLELLLRNMAVGLVLVGLILALFLQLRLALWVVFGIPVAFLGAAALMPHFDISVNMISLFAFLVVLGIVVDDAIVVGENVFNHRARSESPETASIRGTAEVAAPVVASVLTTVAAFLPMFNVPGSDQQIWRVIPLIVIPVLLFSLFESQYLLPSHLARIRLDADTGPRNVLARGWARVQAVFGGGLQTFVDRVYRPCADMLLRWRYLTLSVSVAALVLMVAMIRTGSPRWVFFPSVEGDNVVVSLTMAQGTPAETTSAVLARIEAAARAVRDELDQAAGLGGADRGESIVEHMLASVGSQPFAAEQARNGGQRDAVFLDGAHVAELNLQLVPAEARTVSSDTLLSRLRERIGLVPDAVELRFTTALFSTGKDVDVELYHEDLSLLRAAAADLQEAVRRYPAVHDVADSFRLGKQELKLRIAPQAEVLGLTQQDLARQVRQAFFGEEVQRLQRDRDDVKVMVRYPESARRSLADLEQMRIRTPQGDEVPFGEVAQVEPGRAYSSIQRVGRKRVVRVSAEVDETDPQADAEKLNQDLREGVLPGLRARYPGLTWGFEGDQKKRAELFRGLGQGALIALFLIYALVAGIFRSYVQPLIVLTAIPFGAIGAVLGHLLLGYDLSIMSMFGLVALMGVVVNDNIVLVEWINRRRERHDVLRHAVQVAGAQRFRPIVLTSLTTFGGLTPLIFEQSVQAKFLIPMAISLAFGVMFATVISLVIVPCIYLVLEDGKDALRWLYGWRLGEPEDADPAPPADADAPTRPA